MKYMLCIMALLLIVSIAYADVNKDDGLSYNSANGATGAFDGTAKTFITNGNSISPGYPNVLTSPTTGGGWTVEGTPAQFYVSLGGPAYSATGVYDYDNYKWIGGAVDGENIGVICDVEMWCTESMPHSIVYFHQGLGTGQRQTATLTMTMSSNNGQWVGLIKDDWVAGSSSKPEGGLSDLNGLGKADELQFWMDGFGRDRAWHDLNRPGQVKDIPIQFEYQPNGGAPVQAMWSGGNNNQDWGWYTQHPFDMT
jgi:hypothetical protein